MSSSKRHRASLPPIARLRLEAVFLPKFNNETSADSEIRREMLAGVSASGGCLEATVKHSGSLLLWSGGRRFYSKNSTDNRVTRAGEALLLRHLARCHGTGWRDAYERCSGRILRDRLTCSFEVVTSFLGHHGQLPRRDYLVLVAVADRGGGRGGAYPTAELVRFAQEHRLPYNDTWVLGSADACAALFRSHDAIRETGTTAVATGELDRIVAKHSGSCARVASLCPHGLFQGEILEGLVIRYVPGSLPSGGVNAARSARENLEEMRRLGAASRELLRLVPPSDAAPASVENLDCSGIESIDLRALAATDSFELQVEDALRKFHGKNFRQVKRWNNCVSDGPSSSATHCPEVVNVASEILSKGASCRDRETLDIAQLIADLDDLGTKVQYKVFTEETSATSERRLLCIIHIPFDSSFAKYNAFLREKGKGRMVLFRGFSFELVPAAAAPDDCSDCIEPAPAPIDTDAAGVEFCPGLMEQNEVKGELMLKKKFLPYMVRTLICRDALHLLREGYRDYGHAAFMDYAVQQLMKWKLTDASMKTWIPFVRGWAWYCASRLPLDENTYLNHLEEFQKLFQKGEFRSGSELKRSSFPGTLIIVGPCKKELETLSLAISMELCCSKIVRDVNKITNSDVLMSTQQSSGGLICLCGILEGYKNVRKLARSNHQALFIVMVSGNSEEMADSGDVRRINGITQGWKRTKCHVLLDLPHDSVLQADRASTVEYLRTDFAAKNVMDRLKRYSDGNQRDERQTLIVYFPSIPCSGKSSLCENVTDVDLGMGHDRGLTLLESDVVKNEGKGKYYCVVEKEILAKPASVFILDKNVPPSSFSSVRAVSAKCKSLALPVIPVGIQDTLIGDGASSHVYPFPLQYLAVCMSRVLSRKPNSHKGKLDAGTANACMVIAKFYCFYRNMTVVALQERLPKTVGHRKHVEIPFFKEGVLPSLPAGLKSTLMEAIMLQTCEDMGICEVSADDMNIMEKRLRSSILDNQCYIQGLTVPLEDSREKFVAELTKVIASLPENLEVTSVRHESSLSTIKIASLDFNYKAVHAEIEKIKTSFPVLEQYFLQRKDHKSNDENDKSRGRFISSVHCTFAHASQITQTAMISTFQHLLGTSFEVNALSILFSKKVAALELEIPDDSAIPRPQNKFPHATVWCSEGTEANESNSLLEQVKRGEAQRIVFGHSICMKGVFSFWYC